MKLLRILILLGTISTSAFCNDFNANSAVTLAHSFIDKLRADTPFLYRDECTFWGEESLPGYIILYKLGYVNEQGQWIKPRPEYSFLGELIRLHAKKLLLDHPDEESFCANTIRTVMADNVLTESPFLAQVSYLQRPKRNEIGGDARNIIFYFKIKQEKLDFPILVNGNSLLEQMGFEIDENGAWDINKDKLLELCSKMKQQGEKVTITEAEINRKIPFSKITMSNTEAEKKFQPIKESIIQWFKHDAPEFYRANDFLKKQILLLKQADYRESELKNNSSQRKILNFAPSEWRFSDMKMSIKIPEPPGVIVFTLKCNCEGQWAVVVYNFMSYAKTLSYSFTASVESHEYSVLEKKRNDIEKKLLAKNNVFVQKPIILISPIIQKQKDPQATIMIQYSKNDLKDSVKTDDVKKIFDKILKDI